MRVLFDYQILYDQKYGGISRYYYDLINTIEKNNMASTEISCCFNRNHYFSGYKGIKEGTGFLDIRSSVVRRPLRLFGHLVNQSITKKKAKEADIIHLTYYNPYALSIPKVKKVVTVYDMIEEVKRKNSSLDHVITYKKECIYRADRVIAISESTKRDILKLYPDINPDKISVIYIGTSMERVLQNNNKKTNNKIKERYFPDRYILFVGQRGGYKNFKRFMKAIKPILKRDDTLHLLCIGGGRITEEEKLLMTSVEDRVIQLDANDEMLADAYSNAILFVFPSLYEGFGIPTLEAFVCGCPAVISNTSSMPEVGGDAVLYFNPEDEEEMRMQIEKGIYDNKTREEMKKKGRKRIKIFSWNEIARQTVECYEKALADK